MQKGMPDARKRRLTCRSPSPVAQSPGTEVANLRGARGLGYRIRPVANVERPGFFTVADGFFVGWGGSLMIEVAVCTAATLSLAPIGAAALGGGSVAL